MLISGVSVVSQSSGWAMDIVYFVSALTAVALAGYLVYVLIRPERF
jgi:K+-transporting ATPase KdpF subunit